METNDLSCLQDEGSITIPKAQGSESIWLGEHISVLGGGCTPTPPGQEPPTSGPFPTLPRASLSVGDRLHPL